MLQCLRNDPSPRNSPRRGIKICSQILPGRNLLLLVDRRNSSAMAVPLPQLLRDAALSCCQVKENMEAEETTLCFLDILESPLHDVEFKRSAAGEWLVLCEEMLRQALSLLEPSTTSGQVLCEKVGLDLPRVVVKFVSLSQVCRDICLRIIEALAGSCSPREMFASFMEALNIYTTSQTLIYCLPLVQGLSLVFTHLNRRQAQFFKEMSPGLLALVRLAMRDDEDGSDDDERDIDTKRRLDDNYTMPVDDVRAAILENSVQLAQAVRATCNAVVGEKQQDKLKQRLGMFALQFLVRTQCFLFLQLVWTIPVASFALVCIVVGDVIWFALNPLSNYPGIEMSRNKFVFLLLSIQVAYFADLYGVAGERIALSEREVSTAVIDLVELLPFCGISLCLLLTGDQIRDLVIMTADETNGDIALAELNKVEAMKGAALTVSLALSNSQVEAAAEFSMDSLREKLQLSGRTGVISALSVAASLLPRRSTMSISSAARGFRLIYIILEMTCPLETSTDEKEENDWPDLTVQILPILQTLQEVIVYAPSIEMRRQGYAVLKKVIQEVLPDAVRFYSLQALISSCPLPSLVSLLLICIKDEVARTWPASNLGQGTVSSDHGVTIGEVKSMASPFITGEVLQLVESVLRPSGGVLPDLPAQIDSVQSALNLYRFILIRESSGKTNYTGILSKRTLTKARTEWLLPLCELMGGVRSGVLEEEDDVSADMALALDNLQSVLYRSLELTEEALLHR